MLQGYVESTHYRAVISACVAMLCWVLVLQVILSASMIEL